LAGACDRVRKVDWRRLRPWIGVLLTIAVVVLIAAQVKVLVDALAAEIAAGQGEPFLWSEGVSVWPSLVLRLVALLSAAAAFCVACGWLAKSRREIEQSYFLPKDLPATEDRGGKHVRAVVRFFDWLRRGPLAPLPDNGAGEASGGGAPEPVTGIWLDYRRATSPGHLARWVATAWVLYFAFGAVLFLTGTEPTFPHRGDAVLHLHNALIVLLNIIVLPAVIFWVVFQTRACAAFVRRLSVVRSQWPDASVDARAYKLGLPKSCVDDSLDFDLVVDATARVNPLIYMPFVLILLSVVARSSVFDNLDLPLPLIVVVLVLSAYAVYSALLLRRVAQEARRHAVGNYEARLALLAGEKIAKPANRELTERYWLAEQIRAIPVADRPAVGKRIDLLIKKIEQTKQGAFQPLSQQPFVRAVLLPFGGYGGLTLLEYLGAAGL
jgi:hypothetical protein